MIKNTEHQAAKQKKYTLLFQICRFFSIQKQKRAFQDRRSAIHQTEYFGIPEPGKDVLASGGPPAAKGCKASGGFIKKLCHGNGQGF